MGIKILGISGSPRKESNSSILVHEALRGATAVEDVQVEFIGLAGKNIAPCSGCEVCRREDRCVYKDDFQPIYQKMLEADGIILGSPSYYGTVSAQCKALMDRCYYGDVRAMTALKKKPLRLKVGGAIAVAGGRHSGHESTLQALVTYFTICEMLPVGIVSPHSQLGATGIARDSAKIREDKWERAGLNRKTSALEMSWMYGRKIATIAKIVKAGIAATRLDVPDVAYGADMPEIPYNEQHNVPISG